MPSKKVSKKALKVKKWVPKKGWVIKEVKNPVVFMAVPSYPPLPCPKCHFYPCYADAYGSYRCPRCGNTWKGSTPAKTGFLPPPPPLPARKCPHCGYYPICCKCGICRCPHCGWSWQCSGPMMKKRTPDYPKPSKCPYCEYSPLSCMCGMCRCPRCGWTGYCPSGA